MPVFLTVLHKHMVNAPKKIYEQDKLFMVSAELSMKKVL